MPEPPPRKRFQIHLSTAIVLTFVAGALMWVNLHGTRIYDDYVYVKAKSQGEIQYGWPIDVYSIFVLFPHKDSNLPIEEREIFIRGYPLHPPIVFARNLAIDIFTAISILATAWFLCERLIHRRAARKEP